MTTHGQEDGLRTLTTQSEMFYDAYSDPSHARHSSSTQGDAEQENPATEDPKNNLSVRWITLVDAVGHQRLDDIQNISVLSRNTRVFELPQLAKKEVFKDVNVKEEDIECYLSHCYLSTCEANPTTLGDLHCPPDILNIFVVNLTGDDACHIQAAQFDTLKELLFRPMRTDPNLEHKFSQALLQLTHFPPAALALADIVLQWYNKEKLSSRMLASRVLGGTLRRLHRGNNIKDKDRIKIVLQEVSELTARCTDEKIIGEVELRRSSDKSTETHAWSLIETIPIPACSPRDEISVYFDDENVPESSRNSTAEILANALYSEERVYHHFLLLDTNVTKEILDGTRLHLSSDSIPANAVSNNDDDDDGCLHSLPKRDLIEKIRQRDDMLEYYRREIGEVISKNKNLMLENERLRRLLSSASTDTTIVPGANGSGVSTPPDTPPTNSMVATFHDTLPSSSSLARPARARSSSPATSPSASAANISRTNTTTHTRRPPSPETPAKKTNRQAGYNSERRRETQDDRATRKSTRKSHPKKEKKKKSLARSRREQEDR